VRNTRYRPCSPEASGPVAPGPSAPARLDPVGTGALPAPMNRIAPSLMAVAGAALVAAGFAPYARNSQQPAPRLFQPMIPVVVAARPSGSAMPMRMLAAPASDPVGP